MIVDLHEAETHLSRLVDQVNAGSDVVIARAGEPVARLVPVEGHGVRRTPGSLVGRIVIVDDFDETPDWLVGAFDGRAIGDEPTH